MDISISLVLKFKKKKPDFVCRLSHMAIVRATNQSPISLLPIRVNVNIIDNAHHLLVCLNAFIIILKLWFCQNNDPILIRSTLSLFLLWMLYCVKL